MFRFWKKKSLKVAIIQVYVNVLVATARCVHLCIHEPNYFLENYSKDIIHDKYLMI